MKIILRLDAKTDDQFYGQVIAFAFLKTILIEFLQLVTGIGPITTYFVYAFLMVHLYFGLFKRDKLNAKYFLVWLSIISFILLNYMLGSSEARSYYYSTEMIINYLYYLPIAIVVVDNIYDTQIVYDCINRYKFLAIGLATVMLFFYSYGSAGQDNYMAFSYALLPFVLIAISDGIKEEKPSSYLLFSLGLLEILFYGARTPLAICLIYATFVYFYGFFDSRKDDHRKLLRATVGLIFVAMLFVWGNQFLNMISSIAIEQGSYSMARFLQGHFFSSSTRDRIYEMGIELIKQKAGLPLWFFADRVYLGVIYVHNIFLEFMIDFGLYLGGALSITLIVSIITALIKSSIRGDIYFCLFLIFAIFARFIVSGSYLSEGMSFVFFAFILKFNKYNKYLKGYSR